MSNLISIPSEDFLRSEFDDLRNSIQEIKKMMNARKPEEPKFYRNKDLYQIFKLSDNTIRDYRQKGILKFQKLGDIYYYPVDEVKKEMARNGNIR